MKTTAPDKIYLRRTPNRMLDEWYRYKSPIPPSFEQIEYIRTDAFIDKADEFIGSFFHPDDTELRSCLLKKFHEYMKGE